MAVSPYSISDAVRRQVLLEGVKRHEAERFLAFLKEIDADLRLKLTEASDYSAARMNAQLSAIKVSTRDIIEKYTLSLDDSFVKISDAEAKLEASALNKAITQKAFVANVPDAAQLIDTFRRDPLSIRGKGQGMNLNEFMKAYTDDQVNLIGGRISQGVAEGETTQQIIQSLRGTKARNYADGILATVDRNTEIMVRTATQNVSSATRNSIWEDNQDVIKGYQWVSTLDSRTTEQCQALDGQIFNIGEGPLPPIHYGCRSTTAPVLADDLQYLEKGQTRAARGDGGTEKVSAKTSYYDWLKNQDAAFQDHALGATKAAYFRSGKISADEFRELNAGKNFTSVSVDTFEKRAKELGIDKNY